MSFATSSNSRNLADGGSICRPGCVLCPPNKLLPLASSFLAQVIVFDLDVPITNGCAVELFHHSKDTPATVAQLQCTLDKASGQVIRNKPRCAQNHMDNTLCEKKD